MDNLKICKETKNYLFIILKKKFSKDDSVEI